MPLQSPDEVDNFNLAIENVLAGFWTSVPGRVTAFNTVTQRATVQPLVKNVYYRGEERIAERMPEEDDVPVLFPGGSDGHRLTFPFKAGALVLLVYTSCSLDKLLAGRGEEVDPTHEDRNRLGNAVALTGFYSFGLTPTSSAPDDATVMWGSNIKLGGPGANDAVARAPDVQAAIIGCLSDPTVSSALASNTAVPATVGAYFAANPVGGSSVVKAVD